MFDDYFKPNHAINQNLRNRNTLIQMRFNKNIGQKSFTHWGTLIWNNLPTHLKVTNVSLETVKVQVEKTLDCKGPFYDFYMKNFYF